MSEEESMADKPHGRRWVKWAWLVAALPTLYLFSSGPLLGLSFWLREKTHWDAFYAVLWLYYPLLIMGHGNPVDAYIDWWVVRVFQTVGPG